MPIIFLLVLAILIAQFGFWDTLSAILGGVAMIILLIALLGAIAAMVGWYAVRRVRRRF